MQAAPDSLFSLVNCVPSLRTALETGGLDCTKILMVAVPVRNPDERPLVPKVNDRRYFHISDGTKFTAWEVESLTGLFRGDGQTPALGNYPEAYNDSFMLLDLHALELGRFFGDPRDEEMLEIYSTLRRRPDGKSLGFFHDYVWQAAALVLGGWILSKAEFEAILSRLERSCRTFRQGPTSRNYVAALRRTFEQDR
jgi:hypothetical protein